MKLILSILLLTSTGCAQRAFFHGQAGNGGPPAIRIENLYCTGGDGAHFGTVDGSATLPQTCVFTRMAATPSPGALHTVATNCSDFNTQVTAAVADHGTVVVPASATCTGNFTLPAHPGGDRTHWVTVRTDQIANANFPSEGIQATPCQINVTAIDGYPDYTCGTPAVRMPKFTGNVTNGSTLTVNGNFYRIIGLNITKNNGVTAGGYLVDLSGTDHVIIDRCLIHGEDWSASPAFDTHIGVQTAGTYQAIINSWIYDIDWNAADGEGIAGGIGNQADEGPLKIYGNLLAAGSESFIFGGGFAVAWPHDYEIRRNLSIKPLKWFLAFGATSFNVSVNVKNLGEYKHGHRVLIEDNVLMNNWEGQSDQAGKAFQYVPKNQGLLNTSKFVNTSGTAVTCASDAGGTVCGAHTGVWGNSIVSIGRTSGIVTLLANKEAGFPSYHAGGHVVLQGIPSQVVSGVNLNTFNGEWTMGCLNPTTCTDGFVSNGTCSNNCPIYFAAAGSDFAVTATGGGLAQDFTAATCGVPNHCHFAAPSANFSLVQINSVTDSEHITVNTNLGTQTGATQTTCHPGLAPNAQVQDFTARFNYISHSENIGFDIINAGGSCGDVSLGVSNVSLHDNLADDIDVASWIQNAAAGHGGTGPIINNGFENSALWPKNISLRHNTFAGLRGYKSIYFSSGGFEISDVFNGQYSGSQMVTVERISNNVSIVLTALAGTGITSLVNITGFTGAYSALNGIKTVTSSTPTNVQFTEPGPDITPPVSISAGTTGAGVVAIWPPSYYANVTMKDNIFAGPMRVTSHSGSITTSVSAGFQLNLCDLTPTCTWNYTNNLVSTNPYPGYPQPSGGYAASYPTTNPDASSTCTVSGGCSLTDLSGVFSSWGTGLGNTTANNYKVTATYQNAGSDGKDLGADIGRINTVKAAILPHFTYAALTISTASLTNCTNGVYCEQQLLISNGASGQFGFVKWHLISGSLPAGMNLSTFDNSTASDGKVNGAFKTGPTGSAGWLWGTPVTPGSYPMTFQAEDAGHQTANVALTLTVN